MRTVLLIHKNTGLLSRPSVTALTLAGMAMDCANKTNDINFGDAALIRNANTAIKKIVRGMNETHK